MLLRLNTGLNGPNIFSEALITTFNTSLAISAMDTSPISAAAAIAPALAPAILFWSKNGANVLIQDAEPTWYNPMNPQPAKDRCISPEK